MYRQFQRALISAGTLMFALLTTVLLPGCGGGGDGGSSVGVSNGTLQVAMTDKQSDSFSNVVVAIKEIRVVPAGKENASDSDPGLPVIATFSPPKSVDVLTLRFLQEPLGTAVIPAGSYNQVRLILAPNPPGASADPVNYLTLNTAPQDKIPLTTPSGQQSGLKVLGHFTVKPGVINAILIDFDPNTAIVDRGNGDYNLKPTGIRIVELSSPLYDPFGSLSGTVVSTFKDFSSATVSVIPTGSSSAVAAGRVFSNFSSNRWEAPFTSFVPGGDYRVHIQSRGFELYSTAVQTVPVSGNISLGDLILVPQP